MRVEAQVTSGSARHLVAKRAHLTILFALTGLLVLLAGPAKSYAAGPPAVVDSSVSAVTYDSALLEAEINPEEAATTYHFEYGLADCGSSACTSLPVPDGNVGSGSTAVAVVREAEGLEPGTTYHFRVVAENANGVASGPDMTFTTYSPAPAASCLNETTRVGASAFLPDCRSYEMVSPVDKNGGGIVTAANISSLRTSLNQVSESGDEMTFSSYKAFADAISAPYSNQYLASRGSAGWSTRHISPPLIGNPREFRNLGFYYQGFSADLSSGWLAVDFPASPTPDFNLTRRDNLSDTFQPLSPLSGNAPDLAGVSADNELAVFGREGGPASPEAYPGGQRQTYITSGGTVRLVSALPDGTPYAGASFAGHYPGFLDRSNLEGAVSTDGTRVFWTDRSGPGNLYVRINADQPQSTIGGGECTEPEKACTIQVGTSEETTFWAGDAEGSAVIYTKANKGLGYGDLYRFDVDSGDETLLAPKVIGVAGASKDLSYVYFVSEAELAPGGSAGALNLYVMHNGAAAFVAALDEVDIGIGTAADGPSGYSVISRGPQEKPTRVTPDGRHIAFQSIRSLTGYDNIDARNGERDLEVFIYSASAEKLICASCNPSNTRPLGQPLQIYGKAGYWPVTNSGGPRRRWTAAWLPANQGRFYKPRSLAADGNRLFFNSFDALVPEDSNNQQDVYQWEAQGSGGCTLPNGCVSLISTGTDGDKSEFVDATPSGDDVFFETADSILPQDPAEIDIYDARVNGGYPLPVGVAPCEGDACQSIPAAPNDPTPASSSYSGPGNVSPAVRKHAKKKHRKHAKKKQRQKHHQRGTGRSPRNPTTRIGG